MHMFFCLFLEQVRLQISTVNLTHAYPGCTLCRKAASLNDRAALHTQFFDTSHQIALDARYLHEYGVSIVPTEVPSINFDVESAETAAMFGTDVTELHTGNCSTPVKLLSNSVQCVNQHNGVGSSVAVHEDLRTKHVTEAVRAESNSVPVRVTQQPQGQQRAGKSMTRPDVEALGQYHSRQSHDMKSMFEASLVSNKRAPAPASHADPALTSSGVKANKVMTLLLRSHGGHEEVLHYCATKIQV